jgi:hypothetical protein
LNIFSKDICGTDNVLWLGVRGMGAKGGEVRLIKWGYNAGANFKCVVSQKKNTGKTLNDYR